MRPKSKPSDSGAPSGRRRHEKQLVSGRSVNPMASILEMSGDFSGPATDEGISGKGLGRGIDGKKASGSGGGTEGG